MTTRLTLVPQDAALTIAVRGALTPADTDRIAAICVSLPRETPALVLDLTGAGLVCAEELRRVSRAASRWRYVRAAAVTMRFHAIRHDDSGAPMAEAVAVEVRYPVRPAPARRRGALVPRAPRGLGTFAAGRPGRVRASAR